jgi:hypothetical protein
MEEYSICITTFSNRLSILENLVSKLRKLTDIQILIVINANYKKKFDEEYRVKVLELCQSYPKIFPIFFTEQRGCSKLWNTLIIHSNTLWNLILNDDIEINDITNFENIFNNIKSNPDLYTINNSFSHFLVHKKTIDELMYFDERFIGFGHEDGDIAWRYVEKYNKWIPNLSVNNFVDFRSNVTDEEIIKSNGSKYTQFNQDFLIGNEWSKYEQSDDGVHVNFGVPVVKIKGDLNQYPYEHFFQENKNKL